MEIIAHIRTDFQDKFGIPRQSGVASQLMGEIVFEPKYRQPEAFRGLEEFTYIWIIWQFDHALRPSWSATVKPPRLGGKKRMGVFATRSPFRPNPIGLSCVRLEKIEYTKKLGPVLTVSGIDLLDNTPIYDIKPYLPYTDCHPQAQAGFTDSINEKRLTVIFQTEKFPEFPADKVTALQQVLSQDPRPGFKQGIDGEYALTFAGFDIHFEMKGTMLTVTEIKNAGKELDR